MRAKVEDDKLVVNIPLELINDFDGVDEVIVNWRDDHPNIFTVIIQNADWAECH